MRPSMLDDLGLEPALHWQAKEFSRRYGIPVSVNVEGKLDRSAGSASLVSVPSDSRGHDQLRKACRRQPELRSVVKQDETQVIASVQDDGRGFDALSTNPGLGLMGMTERVRALKGRMSVDSEPGRGTLISVELPARLDSSDPNG